MNTSELSGHQRKPAPPKIVFFDVDETLLSHRTLSIPSSALYALRELRKRGIKLVAATGRGPRVKALLERLGVTLDGYITLNGQYCFTQERLLSKDPIKKEDLRGLLAFLDAHPVTCEFVGKDFLERNFTSEAAGAVDALLGDTLSDYALADPRLTIQKEIFQLNLYLPEDMDALLLSYMPGSQVKRWHPAFNDVISKEGGKHRGVERFLEHFRIRRAQSMAFGDGGNDVELLRAAGTGIAMGNACSAVREAADFVTASVDEDGIYRALAELSVIPRYSPDSPV